ncbi:MAG: hypothetical protein F4179_14315, partial [Gammaproteobacteria bacterium]|nr:hypothetical protein [Gammaproteobacteria bacterium]
MNHSSRTGLRTPGAVRPAGSMAALLLVASLNALPTPVSLAAQQNDGGGVPALAVVPHAAAPAARALRPPTDIQIDGRLEEAPWSD